MWAKTCNVRTSGKTSAKFRNGREPRGSINMKNMKIGSDDSIRKECIFLYILLSPSSSPPTTLLFSPAVIFGIIFSRLFDKILNKIVGAMWRKRGESFLAGIAGRDICLGGRQAQKPSHFIAAIVSFLSPDPYVVSFALLTNTDGGPRQRRARCCKSSDFSADLTESVQFGEKARSVDEKTTRNCSFLSCARAANARKTHRSTSGAIGNRAGRVNLGAALKYSRRAVKHAPAALSGMLIA